MEAPCSLHVSTVKIITSSHLNGWLRFYNKVCLCSVFAFPMFILAYLLTNGQKGMLMFTHWVAFAVKRKRSSIELTGRYYSI
jgi:hypothetical protein